MAKVLGLYLIIIGILIYTTILLIFLEMPYIYRMVLLAGQILIDVSIVILLLDKKEE